MCGRDEFGVIGMRGVNGLAAGFSTNFFTMGVLSDDSLVLLDGTDGGVGCCGGGCCNCGGEMDGGPVTCTPGDGALTG